MFEKKIDVDNAPKKLTKPALDQLAKDANFEVKDSSEEKIEVKFGSWWSAKDNKRGSAELEFKKRANTIDINFSFFSEILVSTLIIYSPILFVVGLAAYGGVYLVSILMTLVLLGFVKYHHYCFEKTADNYHSKLKDIFFVLDSDEFTFCESCGSELDVSEEVGLEKCPICGSKIRRTRS